MPRTWTEWAMGLLLLVAAFFFGMGGMTGALFGIGFLVMIVLTGIISFREIPADPPDVAMPTLFGRRYLKVIREGWVFVFPGIENIIIDSIIPLEDVLSFDTIPCILEKKDGEPMPGGIVDVDISVKVGPDYKDPERYMLFRNNGGMKNIMAMIESKLGELIRLKGDELTWQEYVFAKASLSVEFIVSLTGLESPDMKDPEAVKAFINQALVSGVPDSKELGVLFYRINVTEVDPAGHLREAMNKAAAELVERKGELTDAGTAVQLAMEFLAGIGISVEDFKAMTKEKQREHMTWALEVTRIERGRATEHIVRSSGNPFADAAAMLQNTPKREPPETDART